MARNRTAVSLLQIGFVFGLQLAAHATLIGLPFFWDEAGYYVPAAADLFAQGIPIPQSVPSNAHPPLLSVYVASWWRIFGEGTGVARVAILALSAIGLWGVYRLGGHFAGRKTGLFAMLCTAAYPCYFAQSTMVLSDLPSAVFILLGLVEYFKNRRRGVVYFCLAVLFKETALFAPIGLLFGELLLGRRTKTALFDTFGRHLVWTAAPLALLCAWYLFHWMRTGFVFGNPEFLRYNALATVDWGRFTLAVPIRLWQMFGHLGMGLLTLAAAVLFLRDRNRLDAEGPLHTALVSLGPLTVFFMLAHCVAGGALLARYLLPVIPPLIVLCLIAAQRHLASVAFGTTAIFIVCLNARLPYHYAPEENLTYVPFVNVHRAAANSFEREWPAAKVLTAWPATFELTRPVLGYVYNPVAVVEIERIDANAIARVKAPYDAVLIFNREYEPADSPWRPRRILGRLAWWRATDHWLGAPAGEQPEAIAASLNMELYRLWRDGPFYAAILRPRR